jgi:F-type H+-transporting ATPase subunit epsilon
LVFTIFKIKKMTLQISILTPSGIFWSNKAKKILLPTTTGQIGVLKNHRPLITALDIGVIFIYTENTSGFLDITIIGGFALVKQNVIIILTNSAELPNNLNQSKIEIEFQEATTLLENAKTKKQRIDALFHYKRAKARYQALQ